MQCITWHEQVALALPAYHPKQLRRALRRELSHGVPRAAADQLRDRRAYTPCAPIHRAIPRVRVSTRSSSQREAQTYKPTILQTCKTRNLAGTLDALLLAAGKQTHVLVSAFYALYGGSGVASLTAAAAAAAAASTPGSKPPPKVNA